jgi:hypothetical protein
MRFLQSDRCREEVRCLREVQICPVSYGSYLGVDRISDSGAGMLDIVYVALMSFDALLD